MRIEGATQTVGGHAVRIDGTNGKNHFQFMELFGFLGLGHIGKVGLLTDGQGME